jgi:large repetitive protein
MTPTVAGAISFTPSSLNFTQSGGQQSITIISTDPTQTAAFYSLTPISGAGTNWLRAISPNGPVYSGTVLTLPVTLSVSINEASGSFTSDIELGLGEIPVTYTAGEDNGLGASPASLSFSEQIGGAPPPTQTIQLTGTGGAAVPFQVELQVQPPTAMTITPMYGVTPATLTVSVPAATASTSTNPGPFGYIEILGNDGGQDAQIPFTVNVSSATNLTVSPLSLVFAYQIGSAAPPSQTLQVGSTSGAQLSFSAGALTSWLNVSPSQGSAPTAVYVSISPKNLLAGTYNGQVQIGAGTAQPLTIPVTLTVTPAPIPLSPSPSSVSLTFPVGSAATTQTIQLTSVGSPSAAFTAAASSTGNWLSVTPSSGATPSTLTIGISPGSLAGGSTYTGNITVTPASGTQITIPVSVTVTVPPITASPASLAFTYQIGGAASAPAPQTIQLAAAGGAQAFSIQGLRPVAVDGAHWRCGVDRIWQSSR